MDLLAVYVESRLYRHRLRCFLADNFRGVLVFPQTKEHRLSQPVIARPFREFYLANQNWLDPVTQFHLQSRDALAVPSTTLFREVVKWAVCSANFIELSKKILQQFLVKPGSNF